MPKRQLVGDNNLISRDPLEPFFRVEREILRELAHCHWGQIFTFDIGGGELLIGLSILDNLYVRSARGMREQFRDSIQQLTSSMRQMQTSIEKGSFQTFQSFQPFKASRQFKVQRFNVQ